MGIRWNGWSQRCSGSLGIVLYSFLLFNGQDTDDSQDLFLHGGVHFHAHTACHGGLGDAEVLSDLPERNIRCAGFSADFCVWCGHENLLKKIVDKAVKMCYHPGEDDFLVIFILWPDYNAVISVCQEFCAIIFLKQEFHVFKGELG
jgi:hypothetical protein